MMNRRARFNMNILEIKTGQIPSWINLQTAVPPFLEFSHPDFSYEDESHTYKFGGEEWPSITQLLKHHNLLSDFYTPGSTSKGSAVHKIVQLYELNVLDNYDWDQSLMPYLDGWRKFKAETGWISDKIETPGFNLDAKVCATPDSIGRFSENEPTYPIRRFSLQLKDDGLFKPKRLKEIKTVLESDWKDVCALSRAYWIHREIKGVKAT